MTSAPTHDARHTPSQRLFSDRAVLSRGFDDFAPTLTLDSPQDFRP